MNDVGFYLLIDQLSIQAANTVSSPITYGFPAVTGFLGAIHALSRKLPPEHDIQLDGVLIACHDFHVKRFQQHSYADYTLNQSRNPIKKNGQTASIIEEGKIDLTVSLLVEVRCDMDGYSWLETNKEHVEKQLTQQLYHQRMAGGSVHRIKQVTLKDNSEDDKDLKSALLPAFVLMDATQTLIDITQDLQKNNADATALDALLEVASLHHIPEYNEKDLLKWKTTSVKTGRGWLVPMPVGFQGIASTIDASELTNCRTQQYPSHYVECLYGLGKWVFPHRITNLENCFWRYSHTNNNLYLIKQETI